MPISAVVSTSTYVGGLGGIGPVATLPAYELRLGSPSAVETVVASGIRSGISSPVVTVEVGFADAALPVRLLRADSSKVNLAEVSEAEVLRASRLVRTAVGGCQAFTDDNTVNVFLGGYSQAGLTVLGKAGGTANLNAGEVVVSSNLISRSGSLSVGPVAGQALNLRGRGVTKALNDDANLVADGELLKTSLIGLVNELLTRPCVGTVMAYQNTTGGLLAAGTALALFAEDEIQEASAAADDELSRFLGVLLAATADTEFGQVATTGKQALRFNPGEGAGPHNNKIVYLSTVAGVFTLTAPAAVGNVVLPVGYVANDSGYDNGLGGTMHVHLVRQEKRVVS